MGGRPARLWKRKTYTVSPEVEKAIRVQAAEQDIDPGTVVDVLVWNTYLKPTEARMKQGGFTDEELERIFAEEVLARLDGDGAIEHLAESFAVMDDPRSNLREVRALVRRWRRARRIDKPYQAELFRAIDDGEWIPSLIIYGLADEDWFVADTEPEPVGDSGNSLELLVDPE